MQIVKVFPVNQEVEHVVALSDYLQASFNPVKLSHLEELSLRKSLEE
jgi:hypothetical protein